MSLLDDLRSNMYSTRDLARIHGTNKSRISSLIHKLEVRGYIEVTRVRLSYHNGQVGNARNKYKVLI